MRIRCMLSRGNSWVFFRSRLVVAAIFLIPSLAGCPAGDDEPHDLPAQPLPAVRILVIEDQPLADAIEQEWTASGRGDLEVSVASLESLSEAKRLAADCIVYPSGLLGELAQRQLIIPLPNETLTSETLNRGDFFTLTRMRETAWGKQIYAAPLGSPSIVLLYRRDILQQLDREPPRTWKQYGELLAAIEQSESIVPAEVREAGWQTAVEPLAGNSAAELLLARAAGYARRPSSASVLFDYETMEPLIAQPPFVRALQELVDANRAHSQALEATHTDAREALLSGQCALALTWPTSKSSDAVGELELACAPLPGAEVIYNSRSGQWEPAIPPSQAALLAVSGRMVSLTSSARHTGAASAALVWLASAEVGRTVVLANDSCSLCRSTQVSRGAEWVAAEYGNAGEQYAPILQKDKSSGRWCFAVRIPGRKRYLKALSDAVRTAVTGEKTPELALADAAEQWREITADLGLDAQQDAYARSLGIE